jgi:hypothetical protein
MLRRFFEKLGFHFHDWSKWEVEHFRMTYPKEGARVVRQVRYCKTCGFIQVKRLDGLW